jgi:cytidylate kinase
MDNDWDEGLDLNTPEVVSLRLREQLKITVTGWSASGKTIYAKFLAQVLQCTYVSGSSLLLQELGHNGAVNWVDSRNDLMAARVDSEMDTVVDGLLTEKLASTPRIVMDSWATPWFTRDMAVSVWIDCDLNTRIRNATLRFGDISSSERERIRLGLLQKDADSVELFRKIHGIEFGPDPDIFDVIVDLSDLLHHDPKKWPEERILVLQRITSAIEKQLRTS